MHEYTYNELYVETYIENNGGYVPHGSKDAVTIQTTSSHHPPLNGVQGVHIRTVGVRVLPERRLNHSLPWVAIERKCSLASYMYGV